MRATLLVLLIFAWPLLATGDTTVFLSKAEALARVFPNAERVLELRHLLTAIESARVEKLLGTSLKEGGFFTYVGLRDGEAIGYAVVVSQIGKVKPITHMVGVTPNGEVSEVAVMIYRETHGHEVVRDNFTAQYRGKSLRDTIRIDFDVVNIAGATLSGHALCKGVRKSLAVVQALFLNAEPAERAALLALATDVTPKELDSVSAQHIAAAHEAGHLRIERTIMGTVCAVEAYATNGMSEADLTTAVEAALNEVERWDAVLSDWKPDTPLSQFNKAEVGAPQALNASLAAWLEHAAILSTQTDGAFDPALGALVEAWGLRSRTPSRPGPRALQAARDASGLQRITLELDGDNAQATRLTHGVRLDPGASGKGWALAHARDVLSAHGVERGLLSFRSTLVALGPPPGRNAWEIPIAHDLSGDELLRVELNHQALSVSGGSLRVFNDNGVQRGHVIDPVSGEPVEAERLAWVIHDNPATSDALATALLVRRAQLNPIQGAHGGWVDAAGAELHTWSSAP